MNSNLYINGQLKTAYRNYISAKEIIARPKT